MSRRYFGTDGIRGRVGQGVITPEFMLKLGWAAGRVLATRGNCEVLIGKDTRISGYMFESALEAGLSAAGANIRLLGPMPTPGVAYLTRTFHACAGIVISASHNPFPDNGIKFFSSEGTKLSDDIEQEIEEYLDTELEVVAPNKIGKAARIVDAAGRYIEFCKSTVPIGVNFKNMKLVIDCANGATYQVAPRVFEELGAEVVAIGNAPDGFNINQEYGSTSPGNLITQVIERQADIGIAFDGDGDRVIMIDRHGEIVDGDELVFIMAQYRAKNHADTAIVGTQMSNLGLELAIRGMGVDFRRSAVGDRHVMEMLKQGGWKLGGESSGHIISLDHTTTGDGIVTALQVLTALVVSDLPLHEAKQGMSKYPQCLINIKLPEDLPADKRAALVKSPEVEQAMHAAQEELQENGRILLRASGTEPLFRVMVEGRDDTQVTRLANRLAEVVAQASQ